ncbi:carbamoyltransferase HypF [Nannocystis sp.]|uniref:carbamoyltransferase HypF n=1 Tax=Nannocystis sp. TaxID=1962667 RepID=UPI0025F82A29|nr:carbamoyltransferase HypF [Nannocystis sp.]
MCDATSAAAVGELRRRKHRYGKPFALMARDLDMIARYCTVDAVSAALSTSPEAPIVLLPADGPERLPDDVAPGLGVLGFLLPYTPLHLLLVARLDHPAVVTSGNVSHEPQIIENADALGKLDVIADLFLLHDREIANRIDDSVVRVVSGRPRLLRRARGYAPSAMRLPPGFEGAPDLLAFGGELKSTFCLVKDGAAVLSQHQGDLEDLATYDDYQKNLGLYAAMYDHTPTLLVADLHPEYLSTKLAHERAADTGIELMLVQHHHAHVAACLAEKLVPIDAPAVLGVVMDGLGFGDDGGIWGGEFLLADYRRSRRVGRLAPVAMPGGAMAIHEPWRSLYAHVVAAFGWTGFLAEFGESAPARSLAARPVAVLEQMIAHGINAPLASSCGRLFDAVAAALGFTANRAEYEAQGAMELEAVAARCDAAERGEDTASGGRAGWAPPARPCPGLAGPLPRSPGGTAPYVVAARFHTGVAAGIAELARTLRAAGERFDTVVLSGGCFQNALLLEQVVPRLEREGFTCLAHEKVPTNDGGLALGQVAIAAARHLESSPPPRAPASIRI